MKKKKMPCNRAQQSFPLCGIVEKELTLHMPSGPLLT